jgi:opacity protein-like surface antigen
MKQSVFALVIVCGVCAGVARDAHAQTGTWADRGYVNIGFGIESGSSSLTDTQNITIYEEPGTVTTSTTWTSGSLIDAGFGVRVWRNMTVGVGYHMEDNDTDGAVSGSIPSPIFFNRPRQLSQDVVLERKESAVHLVLGWVVPFSEKLDVMVFGGPSFFRLEQDAVSDVEIGEGASPFTTVVADVDVTTRKKSLTGFNVGADATYIIWSNDDLRIGAGGFVRFTQASGEILQLATEQSTDVGGVQFGFGARIRF